MLSLGSPGRVEAVLDWEMATIGDQLSDLGLTLGYWVWATDPEVRVAGIPALTSRTGWFTRDELLELYGQQTRRDFTHMFYIVAALLFRLAVFFPLRQFRLSLAPPCT